MSEPVGDWKYLLKGHVAHWFPSPWPYKNTPLCRRAWGLEDSWRGTGSQHEYDTAAARRRCRFCLDAGAPK